MNHLKDIGSYGSQIVRRFLKVKGAGTMDIVRLQSDIDFNYKDVDLNIIKKTLENIESLELTQQMIDEFTHMGRFDLFHAQLMFEMIRSDITGLKKHLNRKVDLDYCFRDCMDELIVIDITKYDRPENLLVILCNEVFYYFSNFKWNIREPSVYDVYEFFYDNVFSWEAIERESKRVEEYFAD